MPAIPLLQRRRQPGERRGKQQVIVEMGLVAGRNDAGGRGAHPGNPMQLLGGELRQQRGEARVRRAGIPGRGQQRLMQRLLILLKQAPLAHLGVAHAALFLHTRRLGTVEPADQSRLCFGDVPAHPDGVGNGGKQMRQGEAIGQHRDAPVSDLYIDREPDAGLLGERLQQGVQRFASSRQCHAGGGQTRVCCGDGARRRGRRGGRLGTRRCGNA
ncbi:MAG: hypothetical protein RMJ43_14205 [Chloroherpetonaceae bacterium]|nr:hypothetical protein [Chthonomonadaceae bacterium]MDW8208983.1 hypothetical protein [Chloroherpetonaceae bacterium]